MSLLFARTYQHQTTALSGSKAKMRSVNNSWWSTVNMAGQEKVRYLMYSNLFSVSGEITMQNGLLKRGSQIIIPPPLHPTILETLHTGHLGISKYREKARDSVWWPNLSKQLVDLLKNCTTCCKFQKQAPEP